MPLYLDKVVFAHTGEGRTRSSHLVRVPCEQGSFGGIPLAEAVRLARLNRDLPREQRPYALRVLTDPSDP